MAYWFRLKDIRDEEQLTESQITYLKKCTFKMVIPFWLLFRRQWDLIILYYLIPLTTFFLTYSIKPHFSLMLILLVLGILCPFISLYIGIRYGRRLSWNRKKWDSFAKYRRSERIWGVFGLLFYLLILFGAIFGQTTTKTQIVKPTFSQNNETVTF